MSGQELCSPTLLFARSGEDAGEYLFRIILNIVLKLLAFGVLGNFLEEEFIFVRGKLFYAGEFVEVRFYQVAFGHSDWVEV